MVVIEVNIVFEGPGAVAANVQPLLDSMVSAWTRSIGAYDVSMIINQAEGGFTAYVSDDPLLTPQAHIGGPGIWLNPVTGASRPGTNTTYGSRRTN